MNAPPSSRQPAAAPPSPATAEEALPRRFGKYTLLRRMATGGMAEIYLALQRSVAGFEKLIVIKRILPAMNQDKGFIDMLLHEARVAATLSHPNIVQTIDVGHVDQTYFIALEHVHGEDLRSIVRQMKKKGVTQFPLEHALSIVLGMCAGLAYAHERRDLDGTALNIVHRDVSPQNILVGFAGDVKVVDFGVAKSGTQTAEQTKSGQLKGKVPYMSPEQARGEEVDWRSDIFAVGVMLFELTTGRRLFKGGTEYDTLKLIIEREYPKPSWVATGYPAALEAIVMRALEKDRDKRYQSAREMQADLEAFVRDEKLPVSSIALAEFMKSLFEEKLAAQKEALMQGRQLADIIASEITHTEHTMNTHTTGGADSARLSFTGLSTSGAGSVVESVPPIRRSGGGKWIALGAFTVVAVLGVGAIVFKDKLFPKDAPVGAAVDTPAAKPKAKLVVKSDPPGAHISLNGELHSEVTPAEIVDLPVGKVDVKVSLEGYASQRESIDLVADVPTTRNFTLKKGSTSVQVDGTPKSATATLDGKSVSLPAFDASPGDDHVLVLSAPGMKDKTVKFNGDLGEVKKIDGSMDKAYVAMGGGGLPQKPGGDKEKKETASGGSGKISVSSSGGWCNAFVDGRALGPTPTGMIEVSAGNHSVSCVTESGKKLGSGAKVESGGVARVFFNVGG